MEELKSWFLENKRSFPWRENPPLVLVYAVAKQGPAWMIDGRVEELVFRKQTLPSWRENPTPCPRLCTCKTGACMDDRWKS